MRVLLAVAGLAATSVGLAAPAAAATPCAPSVATPVPQPTAAQMVASGLGRLPVAPIARRVDLVAQPFSNPTSITNPLFPISELKSALLNGTVDGKAFRTETTLLPDTRVIEWSPGQCIQTLVSQYTAYLDGRIQEVALDFYAQADDGSVWYFGEDVYNYERGVVADTSGTWLAGKEGPAAMIMPAAPNRGDVNRPENIPGLVWEEVSVKEVGRTVAGPLGPVSGALVGRELHDDGTFSDKVFAPGYGEFYSAQEGDVEALALALPTNAKAGPLPSELSRLSRAAWAASAAAGKRHWSQAASASAAARRAWKAYRTGDTPRRLVAPTDAAVAEIARAVGPARQSAAATLPWASRWPRSTCASATSRSRRSTGRACDCGPSTPASTRRSAGWRGCGATWRPWNGSGTGSHTRSTRSPLRAWTRGSRRCARASPSATSRLPRGRRQLLLQP